MAKFTNLQQAAFAEKSVRDGWQYWYGTCGYPATQSLYQRKKEQYPSHYRASRAETYKRHIAEKRMVADCVGQIKAFFWTSNGATEAKYKANSCPDRSANGMFSQCKITGAISTIPSTPGLLVWNSGHIGISLDGIWAIEARNFEDGIVKTRIKDRKWTKWGQLPANMLDYVNGSVNSVQPTLETNCPYPEPTVNLKRRVECEGVKWIQWMLEKCGYSVGECGIDGIFGSDTRAAVRSFQRDRALEVDAIVGPLTRNALKVRLEELKHD